MRAVVLAAALAVLAAADALKIGTSKIDATMPEGVPLSGLSARHIKEFPVANPRKYATLMEGSTGRLGGDMKDGTYVRTLIIDSGSDAIAITTMDVIGAEDALCKEAWTKAAAKGFNIPWEKTQFSASHSHSGPGAISRELLWQTYPAVDLFVQEIYDMFVDRLVDAMMAAQNNMQDAVMGIDNFQTKAFTHNRRCNRSPYVTPGYVDPNLGIMRFDTPDGKPLATVWNLAIHGTCFDIENLLFSGDIMGQANLLMEEKIGGTVYFINGPAGDVSPGPGMCDTKPWLSGAPKIRDFVVEKRAEIATSADLELKTHMHYHDFGPANYNLTAQRLQLKCDKMPKSWELAVCDLAYATHLRLSLQAGHHWIEGAPRFSAFSFKTGGKNTVMATIPGEALTELGLALRAQASAAGFDHVIFAGYSQSHMGYIATPREYEVGGYEAILTFWGYFESQMMTEQWSTAVNAVKP